MRDMKETKDRQDETLQQAMDKIARIGEKQARRGTLTADQRTRDGIIMGEIKESERMGST